MKMSLTYAHDQYHHYMTTDSSLHMNNVAGVELMFNSPSENHLSEAMTLALSQPPPEGLYGRIVDALDL